MLTSQAGCLYFSNSHRIHEGNKNVMKPGIVSFRVFPWVPWP
jgi:hypothetical protein